MSFQMLLYLNKVLYYISIANGYNLNCYFSLPSLDCFTVVLTINGHSDLVVI